MLLLICSALVEFVLSLEVEKVEVEKNEKKADAEEKQPEGNYLYNICILYVYISIAARFGG